MTPGRMKPEVVLASLAPGSPREREEDSSELMESGELCPRLLGFGKPVTPIGIVSILRNWGVCGSG